MDKMTTIMVFHSLNVTVQLRTLCLHWSAIIPSYFHLL